MTGPRRACLAGMVLVLFAGQASAQEPTVRDWKYWSLAAGLNGAMLVDTKTTFDVLHDCRQACREANPIAAPFIRRGPAAAVAAGVLFDAGVMTLAAKMKGSPRVWVRRTWWVAPAGLIVGHAIAARHNATLLK